MAEVAPMEALLDAHVLGVPMAAGVQPTEIVESYCVDYQSVPIPFADRIPQPRRRWIDGKLASVSENLAEDGLHFVQQQDFARRLKDLEWLWQQIGVGHPVGQTLQVGTDDSRLGVPAQNFRAFRRKRLLAPFEVR